MWLACHDLCVAVKYYLRTPLTKDSFAAMLHEYGSIEGILKEYQNLTGIDYSELLQQMNTAK